jgi:hypothetical protein
LIEQVEEDLLVTPGRFLVRQHHRIEVVDVGFICEGADGTHGGERFQTEF